MPEISISADQQAALDRIRDDLEDAYVDTYGHVRLHDVIQYLIDTYSPPSETETEAAYEQIADATYPELQSVAADVEDVPGSGIDADEMRGKLLSTLGGEALAEQLSAAETDAATADSAPDITPETTRTAESTQQESADTDDTESSETASPLLSTANQLLDEHDDKWRESENGEEPYEVDLPDDTTQSARTRDDVRQILFKNY